MHTVCISELYNAQIWIWLSEWLVWGLAAAVALSRVEGELLGVGQNDVGGLHTAADDVLPGPH